MRPAIARLSLAAALLAGSVAPAPLARRQDAPAPAAADPAGKFEQTLSQWRELLKELRGVQVRYQNATPAEAADLERQWTGLIAKGEAMLPKLRQTGIAAFRAAPNQDAELTAFLSKLVADDIATDRFEEAALVAVPLAESGLESPELYSHAGVACFVGNDYVRAEKFFNRAAEIGSLTEQAANYRALLPEYRQFWETEKKLREAQADQLPRVLLKTTNGDIEIELFEQEAPGAVGNFIHLVEKGYYDGLTFHRVLPGFMAQGGCPDGTGGGGPGYEIFCECYQDNHRKHFRGTLSMAHAGRDTGGSQFFLTFVPTAHLNGRHTAFGRVVKGMDVLAKIKRFDPMSPNGEPDKIEKAVVLRKDVTKKYQPNRVP